MDKLAIFVEGQTEQIFTERLLTEIANTHAVEVQTWKAVGGQGGRRLAFLKARSRNRAAPRMVMIVDSGSDTRVASDIRENYASLAANGFTRIIGIRDAYPAVTLKEVPRLRSGLRAVAPLGTVPVHFILCVMEVEAWFIAEASHFQRLDPALTPSAIQKDLRFDPQRDDVQTRPHPAEDLDRIYRLARLRYHKGRKSVQRTVDALDFAELYCSTRHRFPDLDQLFALVRDFLEGDESQRG